MLILTRNLWQSTIFLESRNLISIEQNDVWDRFKSQTKQKKNQTHIFQVATVYIFYY